MSAFARTRIGSRPERAPWSRSRRGAPESITTDNGGEFAGQAMDAWAHRVGVKLDFIRPGRPVQNGYIESFHGRLRDECLNTETFLNLADAREKDPHYPISRSVIRSRPDSFSGSADAMPVNSLGVSACLLLS